MLHTGIIQYVHDVLNPWERTTDKYEIIYGFELQV